jgi:IclR family transcriptional regulator, KDG regulon repressor
MRQTDLKSNAIEKALIVLSAFMPYNEEAGTVEISRKLGLHKATTSRILQYLTQNRFLIQNSRTKKFSLGPAILDLSRAMNQSLKSNLVDLAQPFIKALRDRVQETVFFAVLSGEATLLAHVVEGPGLIRRTGCIGDRDPINASAGSKAVLAFLPPETRDKLLKAPLHRFTEKTITDKKKLLRQLEEIRKTGVSFDHEEFDKDTSAIGVPIFDHEGKPVAALVVAGPSRRITLDPNSPMVIEIKTAAANISAQLHYQEDRPEKPSPKRRKT